MKTARKATGADVVCAVSTDKCGCFGAPQRGRNSVEPVSGPSSGFAARRCEPERHESSGVTIDDLPVGAVGPLVPTDRGPRFVAWLGQPTAPEWCEATELFGACLDDALAEVARVRGAPHRAVAGAALVEQYAARLVAPLLAAVLVDRRAVDPALDQVRVQWAEGRVGHIAVRPPLTPLEEEGVEVLDVVMHGNLAVVVEAVHRMAGTGTRVLYGGIAHAVTVAALHLSWPDEQPSRYLELTEWVLDLWGIRDLVVVEAVRVAGEEWLYAERRTCCLAFRTENHRRRENPYCATCPVMPEVERRRSFLDAVAAFRERTGRSRG